MYSETPGPSTSSTSDSTEAVGKDRDGQGTVDMVGAHENVSTTVVGETSSIQPPSQANK